MSKPEMSRLIVPELDCPNEERLIRERLEKLGFVSRMEFDLGKRQVRVWHQTGQLSAIRENIRSLGFSANVSSLEPAQKTGRRHLTWWALAAAMALALGSEGVEIAGLLKPWLPAALSLLAVGLSGFGVYRKGLRALWHLNFNINALMSIAVTGAILLRQWPEAAMVMVLFAIAEQIEARSLGRARKRIRELLDLIPDNAVVRDGVGQWQAKSVSEIEIGAVLRIAPGARIPLDGEVLKGSSYVDQSAVTGESVWQAKQPGDQVFAGSVNQDGELECRTTSRSNQTVFARIVEQVENAAASRAPMQRFIDRFASLYTPAILCIALLTAVLPPLFYDQSWSIWLYRALVLLVIACPCALVLSTPIAVMSALASAAKQGIVIKGGVFLESAKNLSYLALDKTGTLTRGTPRLAGKWKFEPAEPDPFELAAHLAARSDHPASRAIAEDAGLLPSREVTDFSALPGRGVQGLIGGERYFLGSARLAREKGHSIPDVQASEIGAPTGNRVYLISERQGVLAYFELFDEEKAGSREAILTLRNLGVKPVLMSGDSAEATQFIARRLGIEDWHGGLLPEEKVRALEGLRTPSRIVGMVGDGLNDAPALARADLSIAMGLKGVDLAVDTAAISIMDDDLRKIPILIRLSRNLSAVMRQNLVIALGLKMAFLILTLVGYGNMWLAVFADMGASLIVVLNSLRLASPIEKGE